MLKSDLIDVRLDIMTEVLFQGMRASFDSTPLFEAIAHRHGTGVLLLLLLLRIWVPVARPAARRRHLGGHVHG